MSREIEYGYPAIIWSDEDDNFVLYESYELIVRFDNYGGKLQFYNCIDDEMAIAMAKKIANAIKKEV